MSNISKHDAEQEWECDHCKNARIDFFVGRDTVGIDYLLEHPGELVHSEKTRWPHTMVLNHLQSWNLYVPIVLFQ